jgi:hypothetical protein
VLRITPGPSNARANPEKPAIALPSLDSGPEPVTVGYMRQPSDMHDPLSFALEELDALLVRASTLETVPIDLPRAKSATATLRRYAAGVNAPLGRAMIATQVRRLIDAFERVVLESERRHSAVA